MRIDWTYSALFTKIKNEGERKGTLQFLEIAYETDAFYIDADGPFTPRIFLQYRGKVYAYVESDGTVMLEVSRFTSITHELQRRINDLLRSRGWVLICPDTKPPWQLYNAHNHEYAEVRTDISGKYVCTNQGYAAVPRVVKKGGKK